MKRILTSLLLIISFGLGALALPSRVYADSPNSSCDKTILGIPPWYRGLATGPDCTIASPKNISQFTIKLALNIAEILARLTVLLTFALILSSGFRYITSVGSAQAVESAKKTLTNAVIGLIISILATAIVNLVFNAIRG